MDLSSLHLKNEGAISDSEKVSCNDRRQNDFLVILQFHQCFPYQTSWREPTLGRMFHWSATQRLTPHPSITGQRKEGIWSSRVSEITISHDLSNVTGKFLDIFLRKLTLLDSWNTPAGLLDVSFQPSHWTPVTRSWHLEINGWLRRTLCLISYKLLHLVPFRLGAMIWTNIINFRTPYFAHVKYSFRTILIITHTDARWLVQQLFFLMFESCILCGVRNE